MLKLDFTIEQIEALKHQKFHHSHSRVRRKMEALLLKSKGLPHAVIAELVGVSANTLLNYFRQFEQGGVTALEQLNFYQPTSALEPFKSAIITHFQAYPFVSIIEWMILNQLEKVGRRHFKEIFMDILVSKARLGLR